MATTHAPTTRDASAHPRATVTVVSSPDCHLCDDAMALLREFSDDGTLELTVHPVDSPAGQDLMARHRAGLFPLVLVDGQFLSAGRLPRGKLKSALARRSAPVVGRD